VRLPGSLGSGIGGGEPIVTGAGVGPGARLVRFVGVAEAAGLARGVGAWASADGRATIERRVRSRNTLCISCYGWGFAAALVSEPGRGRGGPPDSLIVHSEIEVTVRPTPRNPRSFARSSCREAGELVRILSK
jgi:hypothetical protein